MVRLVLNNESVYVDFSIRSVSDNYYCLLRRVIDGFPDRARKQKLQHRILFGTDFPVNLMSIDSYNAYLDIFSRTEHLTAQEKRLFCSENPERFLFLVGN
ncbi:MAG: amidohydrolase family protein [Dehalococcoidales bacterium]|nr:amidohydrolase family protein [Dehalococcoidales bacterium]